MFSLYEEDVITGCRTLKGSTLLITELTAAEVVDYLEVYEGFSAAVVEGIALSFVDFSYFHDFSESVWSKLEGLPRTSEAPKIRLPDKCRIWVERESNDELLIRDKNELVYTYNRFECGASGFCELVIQWVVDHPIEMIFIGGWIWDRTKDIGSFLWNKFFKRAVPEEADAAITFSPKKFHKKLSKLLNLDPFYFQITGITPLEQGKHTIDVRTIKNEEYAVAAKANGDIISIEKREINSPMRESV